jgi:hypothetical protein
MRTSAILALSLSLLLAGCTGSSEPKSPDPSTSPPATDGETGAVRGVVQSDELMPLKADVLLKELDRAVVAAEDGSFEFSLVPVGKHTLLADKLGYQPLGATIEVVAGATTWKNFTLQPVPVAIEPYNITTPYEGRMTCGTLLVPWCGIFQDFQGAYGTPNPTNERYAFNWTWKTEAEYPVAQVLELVWEPTTGATGQTLEVLYFTAGSEIDSHVIASGSGGTPLRHVVTRDALIAAYKAYPDSDFIYGVYPPLDGLTADQKFTLYRTDFFGEEPPEGWSFLSTLSA